MKFPQSVMIWAAVSSAGVGSLCFLKSTVNAAIYQDILEHFILPSADKLYGEADFIFQQDLAPVHSRAVVQESGLETFFYRLRLVLDSLVFGLGLVSDLVIGLAKCSS